MSMQMSSDRASLVITEPAKARLSRAGVHPDGRLAFLEIEVDYDGLRPVHLAIQAPDVASLRNIVAAMQEGLEQLQPVTPPATELHAALEAHADAESGVTAGVGVGG